MIETPYKSKLTKECKRTLQFQHISTYFNIFQHNHRVQPGHHEFHQAAARPGTFGAARTHQTRRARGWHTDGAARTIIGIAFEGCAWDAWNTGNPSATTNAPTKIQKTHPE